MLDNGTKTRINNARDILVGKVPDPKAQVEQITTALIYKFMHDMDQESVELGGQAVFFSGEYAKYAWSKIMDKRLGGYDRLEHYGQAITRMSQNPLIPQLFRDIFKDAFLPYRDPETLNLFLKEIDGFTYDHSERLGDAFEYLLSVLGSQGAAGQFRTPRHIIDFIVQVVTPTKTDTILDPACGTAGFLISAYKYILAQNAETPLTPDERQRLTRNFVGYDISPDMVRLSLVNMYLHQFPQPTIYEYDTLTAEDRWDDTFDVILANPPFMSPKGGIRPHQRFAIQSKRSEVLFVDYIAEHLNPHGRAGVIVPEGIIFQSSNAYKALRKMLVDEDYLWAVVSLPAGVFQPYSGVKTSILFLDKTLAKRTDQILFVDIQNDGFDLGAQRREIDQDDLPQALRVIQAYQADPEMEVDSHLAHAVPKEKIAEDGDYNLAGGRYREIVDYRKVKWPLVELDEICHEILSGGTPSTKVEEYWTGSIPWITSADIVDLKTAAPRRHITQEAINESASNLIPKGNIIVVTRVGLGKLFLNDFDVCISQDSQGLILDQEKVIPDYLVYILQNEVQRFKDTSQGSTIQGVTKNQLKTLKIPIPPIEVQRAIVAEIDSYQAVIDGARKVVENYTPRIQIDPDWPKVKMEEISTIVRGSSPRPRSDPRYYGGAVPRLMVADVTRDGMYVTPKIDSLTEEGATMSRPMKKGDLVMAVSGQPGLCSILEIDACIHDGFVGFRELDNSRVLTEFAYFVLTSMRESSDAQSVGAVFRNLNTTQVKKFEIPIPSLEIQGSIVEEVKKEQALVEANRELIEIFQAKIDAVIARVWGEG